MAKLALLLLAIALLAAPAFAQGPQSRKLLDAVANADASAYSSGGTATADASASASSTGGGGYPWPTWPCGCPTCPCAPSYPPGTPGPPGDTWGYPDCSAAALATAVASSNGCDSESYAKALAAAKALCGEGGYSNAVAQAYAQASSTSFCPPFGPPGGK